MCMLMLWEREKWMIRGLYESWLFKCRDYESFGEGFNYDVLVVTMCIVMPMINEFKIPLKWYEDAKRSFKSQKRDVEIANQVLWWRYALFLGAQLQLACLHVFCFFNALSCLSSPFINMSLGSESVRVISGSWLKWRYNMYCQDPNLRECYTKFLLFYSELLIICYICLVVLITGWSPSSQSEQAVIYKDTASVWLLLFEVL